MSARRTRAVAAAIAVITTVVLSACSSPVAGSAFGPAAAAPATAAIGNPKTADVPTGPGAVPGIGGSGTDSPTGSGSGAGGSASGAGAGSGPGSGGGAGTGSGAGAGPGSGTGTGGGSEPGAGAGSGSGSGGATVEPTAPPAPTPKIESFRVVTQPTCAVTGTPDAPFSSPGNGVTIAWTVSGADGAAIAVDNPQTYGAYGSSYPASGQLELAFPCGDATGTVTHTYTVWPAGAKDVSKTLTVSARANG